MSLKPGDVFAEYTIIRMLGSGGMGEVYLVQHPRLPRRDALKVLRPEVSRDPDFRQRFIREADLAAALSHPNIVTVYDRGEFDGQLWIATEYIDGSDAAELMHGRYPAGMPASEVSAIVTAVGSALDYAHKSGMLHRDVKPANILCSQPGSGASQRFALADFGIAREIGDAGGMTATNMTLGTVAYAAPEQLMGNVPLDGRADQYALAATAFHLLSGSPPFDSANPVAVISQHLNASPPRLSPARPDLADLDEVLNRALAKDPFQRYPDCTEFARDLERRLGNASQAHNAATQAALQTSDPFAGAPTQAAASYRSPEAAPIPFQHPAPVPSLPNQRRRSLWVAGAAAGALLVALGLWSVPRLIAPEKKNEATTAAAASAADGPTGAVTTGDSDGAKVEVAGFGRPASSDYMWVTSIVRGVQPGKFAVVSFNLFAPDGTIVATESQTEMGVNPNAKMIIGRQVSVPRGKEVSKVEATVGISPGSLSPKNENVILEVGENSVGVDAFGRPAAQALIRNPSQQPLSDTRIGIACFDQGGRIVGGASDFPALIPPGGQIKVSASVMVSQPPARCEMAAQPGGF